MILLLDCLLPDFANPLSRQGLRRLPSEILDPISLVAPAARRIDRAYPSGLFSLPASSKRISTLDLGLGAEKHRVTFRGDGHTRKVEWI